MQRPFSLSASERLKSRKDIETLFRSGKAFFIAPFKIIFRLIDHPDAEPGIRMGISVPKKLLKRAVDRNRIKRRTREAYRIHKLPLKQFVAEHQKCLHLMFIYTQKEDVSFSQLSDQMPDILRKVKNRCLVW
jgi:ribonuclease P protein component